MLTKKHIAALACVLAFLACDVAVAQEWPTKPVTLVVPFAADQIGGAARCERDHQCDGLGRPLLRVGDAAREEPEGAGESRDVLVL